MLLMTPPWGAEREMPPGVPQVRAKPPTMIKNNHNIQNTTKRSRTEADTPEAACVARIENISICPPHNYKDTGYCRQFRSRHCSHSMSGDNATHSPFTLKAEGRAMPVVVPQISVSVDRAAHVQTLPR